jgi:hypothetical protein
MKQLLVGAIAVLLLPVMLCAIVVGLNDDVHFDYFAVANDFHIEGNVHSSGGIPPKVLNILVFGDPGTGNWGVSGYSLIRVGLEDWFFKLDFKTDGFIKYCQWIHFGIKFDVDGKNIITDLIGYWTLNGEPLKKSGVDDYMQVAVTGFEVANDVNGKFFKMMNDTNMAIDISDVELAISSKEVPLDEMDIDGLGRPGELSPINPLLKWIKISQLLPGTLKPGETVKIYLKEIGLSIKAGAFLLIRGEQLQPGSKEAARATTDWGWFWEQHGE